jgi:hypothetical protein
MWPEIICSRFCGLAASFVNGVFAHHDQMCTWISTDATFGLLNA